MLWNMCLCDQSPVKTLDTESLMSFPGHNSLLEKSHTSCAIPLGEDFQKLVPGFPQTSPYVPFLFANFALNSFAIINHSHEGYYMVSPESPTSKSLKLNMVLGCLTHDASYFYSLISLHSCSCSIYSFLLLRQSKFFPASGPLHVLPGMLFPVSSYGSSLRCQLIYNLLGDLP